MLPCSWDLSGRGAVWPVWPGVKAQTEERRKVTDRGRSCMAVLPHCKLELVLLEHFLLEPSQQNRVGQRWPFNRYQYLLKESDVQGKLKNRATCSLCIMTCRFSFLHITRDTLKEEPLQDLCVRSFEWQSAYPKALSYLNTKHFLLSFSQVFIIRSYLFDRAHARPWSPACVSLAVTVPLALRNIFWVAFTIVFPLEF